MVSQSGETLVRDDIPVSHLILSALISAFIVNQDSIREFTHGVLQDMYSTHVPTKPIKTERQFRSPSMKDSFFKFKKLDQNSKVVGMVKEPMIC